MRYLFICFLCWLGCQSAREPYINPEFKTSEQLNIQEPDSAYHSLYLIGDAGRMDKNGRNAVLEALKVFIAAEDENSHLVYLGDNVYPSGLAEEGSKNRKKEEQILQNQKDLHQNFEGQIIFIPGNHDWDFFGSEGRSAVIRQEEFIESNKEDSTMQFIPDHACNDPVIRMISDDLIFLFIDTQWWLQKWSSESSMNEDCMIKTREEFLLRLKAILKENENKQIVLFAHHPIHSNGNHGGYFSLKQNIFPLTDWNRYLWIPLPFVGSLYPIFRNYPGTNQDIKNHKNKKQMNAIDELLQDHPSEIIYASGHEHNMQFFDKGKIKYIVSGAGSQVTHLRANSNLTFGHQKNGFARLRFYSDNETWLEFYSLDSQESQPTLVFKSRLFPL